jgi:hypothetical protein
VLFQLNYFYLPKWISMQQQLFESEKTPGAGLISVAQKKTLSKSQQAFNRLIKRIAALRSQIETDAAKLRKLSDIYNAAITPLIELLGKQKIALAKALASRYPTIKLTDLQQKKVAHIIVDLLNDAFYVVEPDAETEKLYDSFADTPYKEAAQGQQLELKQDLQEQLHDLFGIDIDMGAFDDGPEGFAAFQDAIKEKMAQQGTQPDRKKSKKQLKKEAEQQQQEEIQKRSIRIIYMSLAKLLHPDTETNEVLKQEKEEIMKEVTRAYNEKDLSALLHLEARWLAKENSHLERLPDDTLKIYIAALKEQVKELETEISLQLSNPAFQDIMEFVPMSEMAAFSAIQQEKKERAWHIEEMKKHTAALGGGKLRNAIRDCIEKYYNEPFNTPDTDTDDFQEMMQAFLKRKPGNR